MSQTSKRFSNTKFLKFRVTKYQIKIPPWLEATQPYHILDIITQHQTQTENRELSKSKNVPTINARWQPLKQAIRSIPANRKKKLSVESAFLSFFLIDLNQFIFTWKCIFICSEKIEMEPTQACPFSEKKENTQRIFL